MKRLILILCMLMCSVSTISSSGLLSLYLNLLEKLNDGQKRVLVDSYTYGKNFDLGYTLAAIAWKESNFGMYMTNLGDGKYGSYGVFHILLDHAIVRHNIKATNKWNKSRLVERLIFDFDFSAQEAIGQLEYWKNKFKNKENTLAWAIAGYNAGNKGLDSSKGQSYRTDVKYKIRALEIYMAKNKLI